MMIWNPFKKKAERIDLADMPSELNGRLVVTQVDGVRYLSFGTDWIQGAMRLSRPTWIELEYVRRMMGWMLFVSEPKAILQLGLGAGALAKFCKATFPTARLEVVEIDPSVVDACQSLFAVPPEDELFTIHRVDALWHLADASTHELYDALQVDLYDAQAEGPALSGLAFYQSCWDCLAPGGWMSVNLFGDHASFWPNMGEIKRVFGNAVMLGSPGDGNVVAMARKGPLRLDMPAIERRARAVAKSSGLQTAGWVEDLRCQA